jgi:glycosyltransferase involved in cell wall biosynthesis
MTSSLRPVLLIAFYFPPDSAAGGARPARFFKYLPEFGYAPQVITASEQPDARPGVHYVPAPTLYPNKYTLSGAIEIALHKIAWPTELALLWARAAARKARALTERHRFAAALSTAPPLNTHLAGMLLKRQCRVPWIADFRDPLVGNSYRELGAGPRYADRMLESRIFRSADLVVSVTDVVADSWRARYPEHAGKVRLLWNGYDPEEPLRAAPAQSSATRTLAHIGMLYGVRNPMAILYSVRRLIESGRLRPDALRVQLVGGICNDAARDESTLAWLQERGTLDILPQMPRRDALAYMSSADYLMLLDLHQGDSAYAVPSKLYEYIRIGRPILVMTQPGSTVERILARSGVNYVCIYSHDREDQIDARILELLTLPPVPSAPSEWFLETFDGRRQTAALARILDRLTGGGSVHLQPENAQASPASL